MTELEACVLAVIVRQGPLTAYQVRREFDRSPASSWRASTGSIYPLIKRLSAQGLLEMSPAPHDGRKSMRLAASEAGRARVLDWLKGSPPWLGDVTEDPIRTRVQFLMLLHDTEAYGVVTDLLLATQAAIERLREFMATLEGNSLEALAHEGAMVMLAARLGWLESVKAKVCNSKADN